MLDLLLLMSVYISSAIIVWHGLAIAVVLFHDMKPLQLVVYSDLKKGQAEAIIYVTNSKVLVALYILQSSR